MNDRLDEELARLRDELRSEAARIARDDVSRPTHRPDARRGRAIAVASTLLLVAASAIAIVATRGDDQRVTVPGTDGPQTTQLPATTYTTTTSAISSVPATGGTPIADASAVSFADPQQGHAFIGDDAGNVAIFATTDGGATWRQIGLIEGAGIGSSLTFADDANGWFASPTGVWSTHDGGRTWHSVTSAVLWTADGGPTPFVTDHGKVYAVGRSDRPTDGGFVLYSSPVTVDAFQPTGISFQPGAGPVADFFIAAADGNVWAVYNDRVCSGGGRIVGDAIGTDWTPPACDQGGAVSVSVAHDGGPVYTSSLTGVWTGTKMANVASVSTDGGATFRSVELPPNAQGDQHPDDVSIVPIDAHTVGAVVSAVDGSSSLFRSGDRGATWTRVAPVDVTGIRFIDSTTAVATKTSPDGSGHVERSDDGGVTWTPLGTPPPISKSTPPADAALMNINQVQFVDATNGWMLGEADASARATLYRTTDRTTWAAVTTPSGVDQVTFADTTNGWAWGSGAMRSTHDGGATWNDVQVGQATAPPYGAWVSNGYVYLLVFRPSDSDTMFDLYRSPVDRDSFAATGLTWSKGAGGNEVEASIAAQGNVAFVAYNDRGGNTSRLIGSTAVQNWPTPVTRGGGNIAIAAAADGGPVFVASATGTWGADEPTLVLTASLDGGNTFHTVALPKQADGTPYRQFELAPFAAIDASTLVIGLADGQGVVHLYRTTDRGRTWTALPPTPDPTARLDAGNGYLTAVVNADNRGTAWVSLDGGSTWTKVFG